MFFDMVGQKVTPGRDKVVVRFLVDVHPPAPGMPLGACVGTGEVFDTRTGKMELFLGADAVSGIEPSPF